MARGAPPGAPHKAPVCSLQSLQRSTKQLHSPELNGGSAKKNGDEITGNKNIAISVVVTTDDITPNNATSPTTTATSPPQACLDQEQDIANKTISNKNGGLIEAKRPICRPSKKQNVVDNIPNEVFDHEFATNITQAERQAIVKEYNRVMGRISQNSRPLDEEVGLAEIEKTIRELKPKEDIICLYVRFARQLPSNFHVDSMATVLCVAKQCNYPPYKFLNDVQTLLVCHSSTSS